MNEDTIRIDDAPTRTECTRVIERMAGEGIDEVLAFYAGQDETAVVNGVLATKRNGGPKTLLGSTYWDARDGAALSETERIVVDASNHLLRVRHPNWGRPLKAYGMIRFRIDGAILIAHSATPVIQPSGTLTVDATDLDGRERKQAA